jgi:hypothetical protein
MQVSLSQEFLECIQSHPYSSHVGTVDVSQRFPRVISVVGLNSDYISHIRIFIYMIKNVSQVLWFVHHCPEEIF